MKYRVFRSVARLLAVLLAMLLLALPLTACSSKGKTLLTLEKDGVKVTFSANFYAFLLSRMKGMLVSEGYSVNGVTADQSAFWDYQDKFNGTDIQTLNDYYGNLILDNCRTYLAALWFFEKEGLSLSDTQLENVEERLQDALTEHGGGSKTKLNSVLSNYGMNYSLLREFYLLEEKVTAVQNAKYGSDASLVGSTIKEEFLAENYVHFKQIFLPAYRNIYVTDANGDTVYYVKESQTATICYDTKSGYEGIDKNGLPITDSNGDTVYYTTKNYNEQESPRIAYDKENGIPSLVLNDDGTAKTEELTQEELTALKERADKLYESLADCTVEEFEAAIAKENENTYSEEIYTDGYYLQKNVDYAGVGTDFAYFTDIITAMEAMENGDIAKITSDSAGYHIIMKYAPTSAAYELEVNEPWFQNFNSALVEQLFLEECRTLSGSAVLSEKILASATDIKRIGANFYF